MARLHRDGLYEARLQSLNSLDGGIDYHFEVRPESGEAFRLDDPYRFGRSVCGLRPAPVRRGHAAPRVREARRAPDVDRRHQPACTSPSGRRTPQRVSVVGDFNGWDGRVHPMRLLVPSGVWEIFIPGLGRRRELQVRDPDDGGHAAARRPIRTARYFEVPPRSASIVCAPSGYEWGDGDVDGGRVEPTAGSTRPMSIYEVHLGSWARVPEDGQPLPDVPRAGGAAGAVREGARASRTSSCCR